MTAPAAGLFDEATLVRQAQGGDREAFAQLYDRYFERVYDFVRRTLRNEADAADVTQEVFIKAMGSVSTLSNPSVFKAWLFTIARNLSISKIRGARQTLSLDYSETGAEDATLSQLIPDDDIAGAPEASAERSDVAAMVWAVAAGLDARQYTVLDLSVRQELGPEEMASVLGVTRNNAYVMINRTKAAFSESAGDYLLYREGQRDCPALRSELEAARVSAFSPQARKVVERHIKHCALCGEKKKRLPLPLAMFGGLALAAPPEGLRERIRGSLADAPIGGGLPPIDGGPDAGAGMGGGGGKAVRRFALFAGAAIGALLLSTLAGVATLRIIDGGDDGPPVADPHREVLPTVTPTPTSTPTPKPGDPTPTRSPNEPSSIAPPPSPTTVSGTIPPPPATPTPAAPSSTPPPGATATPTATATHTATPTITPTPSPTVTPTPTPTVTPTPSPTPVPLAFATTARCWQFINGNLRVTVTMSGVNNEALSGSATFQGESADFGWIGNVGTATIMINGHPTGTAVAVVTTATRQENVQIPVPNSTPLCPP